MQPSTAEFLDRIIAPGGFVILHYKGPHSGMITRAFPRADVADAASYAAWISGKGSDVWHANQSYKAAATARSKTGKEYLTSSRVQTNVDKIKVFYMDVDVKREGDKKQAGRVYASLDEAATGVATGVIRDIGMPDPTFWVCSGYGLHLYWVLKNAIDASAWRPYAEALAAAGLAKGVLFDPGITVDSVRILRPPGTLNYKDPQAPRMVTILRSRAEDYDNEAIAAVLKPWLGARRTAAVAPAQAATATGAAPVVQVAGNVVPLFAGRQGALAAKAQANIPAQNKTFYFAEIAKGCEQVKKTLETHGLEEDRGLWYLGNLTLAHFCADGADYVHVVGDGDPRYTKEETEQAVAAIDNEITTKHRGPPTCEHYHTHRPEVCEACPFWGHIHSPISLGTPGVAAPAPEDDLPVGYRRNAELHSIQRMVPSKEGPVWIELIGGDVRDPVLDRIGDAYALTFTYERAGRTSSVVVHHNKLPTESGKALALFGSMGVTVGRQNALDFGDMIVAWINKLRDARQERDAAIPPFGWAVRPDDTTVGLAVGGHLYCSDGTMAAAPGADPQLTRAYTPQGTLAGWQDGCEVVFKDRPDLQVFLACAFGAPLMRFTGEPGLFVSGWSRESAVGKSSAFKLAHAVWADLTVMCSMTDTMNAVRKKTGDARIMPVYWDEIMLDAERGKEAVNFIFDVSQGKDKARLNADATLRQTHSWQTIMVVNGNKPLMDLVVSERKATDAGALRVFEFQLSHSPLPLDTTVAQRIVKATRNYGQAGQVYAAWLALKDNVGAVEKLITRTSHKLTSQFQASNQERFFIAGMSTMLVGAQIAKNLGIYNFDMTGLVRTLHMAFLALRSGRDSLTTHNGKLDVERVLGAFLAKQQPFRLVTRYFKKAGAASTPANFVVAAPLGLGAITVHISQREQLMHIERDAFDRWCREEGLGSTDVLQQMALRWAVTYGGTKHRYQLGAGTPWSRDVRVYCIEVPLTSPELQPCLHADGGAAQAAAQPAPGSNQPKM